MRFVYAHFSFLQSPKRACPHGYENGFTYDFTPDKAKPAKHRSSVEVDELWPSAAGGAAAGAAVESKAPENGDMDCDSDSDLGSRISLHAPM